MLETLTAMHRTEIVGTANGEDHKKKALHRISKDQYFERLTREKYRTCAAVDVPDAPGVFDKNYPMHIGMIHDGPEKLRVHRKRGMGRRAQRTIEEPTQRRSRLIENTRKYTVKNVFEIRSRWCQKRFKSREASKSYRNG